jgi:uncharacterized membrane protein YozB (DUF420 family)
MFGIPVNSLPAVNASLNALATVLLVLGYVLIKQGRETAHKRTMLSAFATSVVFLACYLAYHFQTEAVTKFRGGPPVSYVYYTILITHIILAAAVPVLAGLTIWWGYTDQRLRHVRLARWTFPIWLYVSITGVIIYLMLYHLYPAPSDAAIIAPVWTRTLA